MYEYVYIFIYAYNVCYVFIYTCMYICTYVCVYLCTYVIYVCVFAFISPERFGGFNSYLVHINVIHVFNVARWPVYLNIAAPKIGVLQLGLNTKKKELQLFSEEKTCNFINF